MTALPVRNSGLWHWVFGWCGGIYCACRNGETDSCHFISEGYNVVKKRFSSRVSKTDSHRARGLRGKDVQLTPERPEADLRHIVRGIVRRGLLPVGPKALVSLRIDADVLAWFRAQGRGYQTRINAVLRAFKDASL